MKKLLYLALTLAILVGCGKDNYTTSKRIEFSPGSITLHRNETEQVTTNADDAIFACEDDFYASVDNNGLVNGLRVGKTKVTITSSIGKASIPVTIEPQYRLSLIDFDLLVGTTKGVVTSTFGQPNKTTTNGNGNPLLIWTAPSDYLMNPTGYITEIRAALENDTCSLIAIFVRASTTTANFTTGYLFERYLFQIEIDNTYVFSDHDNKFDVYLKTEKDSNSKTCYLIVYSENSSSKSANQSNYTDAIDKILEK